MLYGSEYVFHPGNRDTGNDITLDRNQIIQGELQILQSPALAAEVLQAVGPDTVYPGVAKGDAPLRAAMGRFASDLVVDQHPAVQRGGAEPAQRGPRGGDPRA